MLLNHKRKRERDTKLAVPYFSQHRDIRNAEYRPTACGMTCAYMALQYFGAQTPSLDALVEAGMQNGGYRKRVGWIHDYFVSLFRSYGYGCERRERMSDEDIELLRAAIKEGNPVIVSVTQRLLGRQKFHMVVLTGVREDSEGALEGFFYHDPASLDTEGLRDLFVSMPEFLADWRRMAIFPKRG